MMKQYQLTHVEKKSLKLTDKQNLCKIEPEAYSKETMTRNETSY